MSFFDKWKIRKISPAERRRRNLAQIKTAGIACHESLPLLEDTAKVSLKDTETICKRAIACLFSIQVACDIYANDNIERAQKAFSALLEKYNAKNSLLKKELLLFEGNYTPQVVADILWTYETYWAIVWALGLIDNMDFPDHHCDAMKAIQLVKDSQNLADFKSKCHLRKTEEILDMLDLYYCYHWACVEKQINPQTPIGKLNPEIVMERRRGLEWLIASEDDWNKIPLDT